MQKFNQKDSLEEFRKKMAHNNRVLSQARAAIKRAKNAGIPDKYLRINKKNFVSLLDNHYHDNVEEVANFIYDKPIELLKKEFIIIDGGDTISRKKACYAIMFRLISCEKNGISKINSDIANVFQELNRNFDSDGKNETVSYLKSTDLLLLMEAQISDFRTNFNTGRFYDVILSHRDDFVKTTIISFSSPLASNKMTEKVENSWNDQEKFGQYFSLAGQSYLNNDDRFFKIRVKSNG